MTRIHGQELGCASQPVSVDHLNVIQPEVFDHCQRAVRVGSWMYKEEETGVRTTGNPLVNTLVYDALTRRKNVQLHRE